VIINNDSNSVDKLIDIVIKTLAPLQLQSLLLLSPTSPYSPFSSSLFFPPSSLLSLLLLSISILSRILLYNISDNVGSYTGRYTGIDRLNKRKHRRTLYRLYYKDTRSRLLLITSSIESSLYTSVNKSCQPVETIVQLSFLQLLQTAAEESIVPEGRSSSTILPDIADASEDTASIYQITQPLEGSISEILRFEDTVDIIISVLVNTVKIQIQTGKFSFEKILVETTTNIAEIRKYTE
jgi:hypothetical protein